MSAPVPKINRRRLAQQPQFAPVRQLTPFPPLGGEGHRDWRTDAHAPREWHATWTTLPPTVAGKPNGRAVPQ